MTKDSIEEVGNVGGEIHATDSSMIESFKMSGWFKAWLILLLITSASTFFLYFFTNLKDMRQLYSTLPEWVYILFLVRSAVTIFFVANVFRQRRWAIIGYVITFSIAFAIDLYLPFQMLQSLLGVVGLIIFILLVRPLWRHLNNQTRNSQSVAA